MNLAQRIHAKLKLPGKCSVKLSDGSRLTLAEAILGETPEDVVLAAFRSAQKHGWGLEIDADKHQSSSAGKDGFTEKARREWALALCERYGVDQSIITDIEGEEHQKRVNALSATLSEDMRKRVDRVLQPATAVSNGEKV